MSCPGPSRRTSCVGPPGRILVVHSRKLSVLSNVASATSEPADTSAELQRTEVEIERDRTKGVTAIQRALRLREHVGLQISLCFLLSRSTPFSTPHVLEPTPSPYCACDQYSSHPAPTSLPGPIQCRSTASWGPACLSVRVVSPRRTASSAFTETARRGHLLWFQIRHPYRVWPHS